MGVVDKVFLVFSQDGFSSVLWSRSSTRTGVVLAVVDVPVICSNNFPQFLFFDVKVPQLQFIGRVAETS